MPNCEIEIETIKTKELRANQPLKLSQLELEFSKKKGWG
jgi:hypothetical protein